MLGFLLARAGVDVVVLEKHADFLRDFRGDTIHPSTMQIMHELGMLDEFLKLPHQRVSDLTAQFGDERLRVADFSSLPVAAPFIAMMPQWDFLNFLVERAKDLPGFRLLMRTQATGLLRHDNKVTGVAAHGPEGNLRFSPCSASEPMAAIRPYENLPDCRLRISAPRWMYCGSVCRGNRATRRRRKGVSTPAASSSCSIVGIIGNAPL